MRLPILFLSCLLPISSVSAQQSNTQVSLTQECSKIYTGVLQKFSIEKQAGLLIESMSRDTCDLNNFDLSAGFDSKTQSVIGTVPVVSSLLGSLNIHNNKQFCEAYKSGRFGFRSTDITNVEPIVDAMKQVNECIRISLSSGVVLTSVSPNPSQIVISGKMTANGSAFKFSGLTSGGFQCVSPKPSLDGFDPLGSIAISRNENFGILCSRNGYASSGNPKNTSYDLGSVTLATSNGDTYSVSVSGDELYGLETRSSADSLIKEAQKKVEDAEKQIQNNNDITLSRLQSAKVVRFYFNGTDAGPGPGSRYACDIWNGGHAIEKAAADLCSYGSLVGVQHLVEASGGDCGFNIYNAVCIPK